MQYSCQIYHSILNKIKFSQISKSPLNINGRLSIENKTQRPSFGRPRHFSAPRLNRGTICPRPLNAGPIRNTKIVIFLIFSELFVVFSYPLQIEQLMRDINTLYPSYKSRPWVAASDGENTNGSGEIAVSRRICESIFDKRIT